MRRSRPSRQKLARLADFYTELHEGKEPTSIHREKAPKLARPRTDGSRIAQIQYRKMIPDQTPHYWHPYKPHARPTIGFTRGGTPVIATGRYEVTTHGIEDLPENKVRRESWPKRPNELIDLGVLEWLKVELPKGHPEGKYKELNFGSSPEYLLSRDQRGNLHVLKEGEREMRHRRTHHRRHSYLSELYSNPKHHGRKHRKHRRRHNPTLVGSRRVSGDRGIQGIALGALFLAGSGLVSLELVQAGVRAFVPSTLGGAYNLQVNAGIKVASGVALGMVARALGAPHVVVAGAAVGPTLDGLKDLYDIYVAPQLQGAHRALVARGVLPSGMPQNFQSRTPDQCRVA